MLCVSARDGACFFACLPVFVPAPVFLCRIRGPQSFARVQLHTPPSPSPERQIKRNENTTELATFSASNAEDLYRIVYESDDDADEIGFLDMEVGGGVYWVSHETISSGRGARFVVARLDITQASPGADGID